MLVKKLFSISTIVVCAGCSSGSANDTNRDGQANTGGTHDSNPGVGSTPNQGTTAGGAPAASSSGGAASGQGGVAGAVTTTTAGGAASGHGGVAGAATTTAVGGAAQGEGGAGGVRPSTSAGGAVSSEGGVAGLGSTPSTAEGGAVPSEGGTAGSGSSPTTAAGGVTSTGGTTAEPDGSGGLVGSGGTTAADTGPCAYECTDFCLNAGGEVMPGTCSQASYVCCNVEPDEATPTGEQFYIDSDAGKDDNDGKSPEKAWKSVTKIASAGAGATVNLKRGGVWETDGAIEVKDLTIRPYGTGPRPVVNGKNIQVPESLATIVLKGNAVMDAIKVTSDQGFGAYIYGDNNVMRNIEVDGTGTGALMGIGIIGDENEVTGCYVHDLTTDTGDTGDPNSSGGAEGIVVFAGSHINVGHNTVARAHCANKTLGGDEGGCTEIIMNPMFFSMYGDTVEDVQFHHNLCVDTVGLFESCQGTGDPGFNPTENPGHIKDITVAYNVVLDSKWMYLAQIVNTTHENVVFEHNTIIHGPRNDTQWYEGDMSHEMMLGMFFSFDPTYNVGVSDSLTSKEMILRNNLFWEPFTSEDVFIGYTSGHSNNLFGPASISLESRWTLDPTEQKSDDLGLVDVFHPTAESPAVNKASTEGYFDTDFYGNAMCDSAPDIGAVEYCPDAATKAKSDEVTRYLEANQ